MSSNLVEISSLSKRYGRKSVLDGLSLNLPAGSIVGLLGPNGAGKTTLIKILAGVLRDYSGSVKIGGMPVGPETKRIVAYLPDRPCFSRWMRVRDAVKLFADFYEDFDLPRACAMLEKLRIEPDERLARLSKGTYEKVQLVAVMSRRARLYLLDEPVGGVDPASRDVIIDTILNNYSENSTLLISTQLISDLERVFDSVVMLNDRRVVLSGEVDELRAKYGKSIDELFREVFKCC